LLIKLRFDNFEGQTGHDGEVGQFFYNKKFFSNFSNFKLLVLEFAFTFAYLVFGRLVLRLLNCSHFNLRFTFACLAFGRQALTLLNR
jgi:hypothetical protein